MSAIVGYMQEQAEMIERHLEKLVPVRHGSTQHLFEAVRHALLGGGKRLRPILLITTAQLLGANPADAIIPACAIEMIHTYSMIHDDLPCMDNDDFRRGRPTVHKQFGEALAVLAGDFLLTYAFEILASCTSLKPEISIAIMQVLAKQSGGEGMIGGQVMDLSFEGKNIAKEELILLHRLKTAALIRAAMECGSLIAGANAHTTHTLLEFGEHMGLAFQIVDDILDVTSSKMKHGHTLSSDLINGKSTYVTILGMEQAITSASTFHKRALTSLKSLPYDTTLLVQLADVIMQRKS